MTRYRKAIAAFITPLIGLPIAGWVSGEVSFSEATLGGTIISAVTAVFTYYVRNEPAR